MFILIFMIIQNMSKIIRNFFYDINFPGPEWLHLH